VGKNKGRTRTEEEQEITDTIEEEMRIKRNKK
jgi:hypothetical protein